MPNIFEQQCNFSEYFSRSEKRIFTFLNTFHDQPKVFMLFETLIGDIFIGGAREVSVSKALWG
jgi:hypothetical protein